MPSCSLSVDSHCIYYNHGIRLQMHPVPLPVNVVQLAAWQHGVQDFWLSHWTLKLTHPHIMSRLQPRGRAGFCSVSCDHVMGSPRNLWRPQVQVKARVSGSSPPHMVRWSLGLWDTGSKGLGSCSWETVWGWDGASYIPVARRRRCPGGVTRQFTRRYTQTQHCATTSACSGSTEFHHLTFSTGDIR